MSEVLIEVESESEVLNEVASESEVLNEILDERSDELSKSSAKRRDRES